MKHLIENWKKYLVEVGGNQRYEEVAYNSTLAMDLLAMEEGDEAKSSDAIAAIKAGDWEKDPKLFYSSLTCNAQTEEDCLNKHPEMTTPYPVSELSGMDLYKVAGMNVGFALKKKDGVYQEIVAVHNNEPGVGGIGKILMHTAISAGGCYLDHFSTSALTNLYSSLGFEEYGDRLLFDPQYVSDEFVASYGQPDIIFRKHKDC